MGRSIKTAFLLVSIAYPFVVYWGLSQDKHTWLLAVLLILLASRFWVAKQSQEKWVVVSMTVVVLMVSWLIGYEKGLKLYPVMINLSFLALFGFSLFTSMPIVERIARLREPNLPLNAVQYTRRVTQAWSVFFSINGLISLYTVFAKNEHVWLIYNGFISYILIATMMLVEWLIRRRVRRNDV
jgi:uncharacterized membrane protein